MNNTRKTEIKRSWRQFSHCNDGDWSFLKLYRFCTKKSTVLQQKVSRWTSVFHLA